MSDGRALRLRCCECGEDHPFDPFVHRCRSCGEALEVPAPSRQPRLDGPPAVGKRRFLGGNADGLWRFSAAFPGDGARSAERRGSMSEGGTPLLRARGLGEALGCGALWLKDETRNPTGSFKDRGTAVGISVLSGLGFDSVGTVSTGNMARSVAAYAARAGLSATIWLGADIPDAKLAPIAVHGARLFRFDAPYGEIYAASLQWGASRGIPFINSDSALRVEGQKTIAYEIADQFGATAPEWMVIPTSSGGNLSAIGKGFAEAVQWGWIDRSPRLVAVQSAGCAPIVGGWVRGTDDPAPIRSPRTIAGAIANPAPPSGRRAIRWLRQTGGVAIAVTDAEIVDAQTRLASSTGRYVQPASAAGLAALARLLADGVVRGGDGVALLLTGSGTNAPAPAVDLEAPRSLAEL